MYIYIALVPHHVNNKLRLIENAFTPVGACVPN